MDKILITAFLSALAGFLTAVLNIVKLVNEKESKTTDYRQGWTDSVRQSLAELISNLNTQASNLLSLQSTVETFIENQEADKDEKKLKALIDEISKQENAAAKEMQNQIYKSYALARLHFKPNDHSFNRIEQKFDLMISMLEDIKHLKKDRIDERKALKEKVHSTANEITSYARDILKTEWETVKKGEKAYQTTKRWSFIGGTIMLFILLTIGIHASISVYKNNMGDDKPTEATAKTKNQDSLSQKNTEDDRPPISMQHPEQPIINTAQCFYESKPAIGTKPTITKQNITSSGCQS